MAAFYANFVNNPSFPIASLFRETFEKTPRFFEYLVRMAGMNETYINKRPKRMF